MPPHSATCCTLLDAQRYSSLVIERIGDFASTELAADFRAADDLYLGFGDESSPFLRRIVVVC
jgi:hypothetical protein